MGRIPERWKSSGSGRGGASLGARKFGRMNKPPPAPASSSKMMPPPSSQAGFKHSTSDRDSPSQNLSIERWIPYDPIGNRIPGTRFIAFKVPLKPSLMTSVRPSDRFTPSDLIERIPNLGLLIDLTNTDRYYDKFDFIKKGIQYKKILCPGQTLPPAKKVTEFFSIVDDYLEERLREDSLIGVHCTHGVNRTAYFICRYMVQRMAIPFPAALESIERARGYRVERPVYVDHLSVCTGLLRSTKGDEGRGRGEHEKIPPPQSIRINSRQKKGQDTSPIGPPGVGKGGRGGDYSEDYYGPKGGNFPDKITSPDYRDYGMDDRGHGSNFRGGPPPDYRNDKSGGDYRGGPPPHGDYRGSQGQEYGPPASYRGGGPSGGDYRGPRPFQGDMRGGPKRTPPPGTEPLPPWPGHRPLSSNERRGQNFTPQKEKYGRFGGRDDAALARDDPRNQPYDRMKPHSEGNFGNIQQERREHPPQDYRSGDYENRGYRDEGMRNEFGPPRLSPRRSGGYDEQPWREEAYKSKPGRDFPPPRDERQLYDQPGPVSFGRKDEFPSEPVRYREGPPHSRGGFSKEQRFHSPDTKRPGPPKKKLKKDEEYVPTPIVKKKPFPNDFQPPRREEVQRMNAPQKREEHFGDLQRKKVEKRAHSPPRRRSRSPIGKREDWPGMRKNDAFDMPRRRSLERGGYLEQEMRRSPMREERRYSISPPRGRDPWAREDVMPRRDRSPEPRRRTPPRDRLEPHQGREHFHDPEIQFRQDDCRSIIIQKRMIRPEDEMYPPGRGDIRDKRPPPSSDRRNNDTSWEENWDSFSSPKRIMKRTPAPPSPARRSPIRAPSNVPEKPVITRLGPKIGFRTPRPPARARIGGRLPVRAFDRRRGFGRGRGRRR